MIEIYHKSLDKYDSKFALACLGFFQTLNLQHGGVALLSMRDVTDATLFVWAIAMHLGPLPFISLLLSSGDASRCEVEIENNIINNSQDIKKI